MHLSQQCGRRHQTGARGGQLDGQGETVQCAAQLGDGGELAAHHGGVGAHRPGPGQEELDRRPLRVSR